MPMISSLNSNRGFTLSEVVIVIVILGILASVAIKNIVASVDDAKYQQTQQELEQLACAIRGNPAIYGLGTGTDFGYVGDVGALPPNLDALVQNPGSYTTWKGPYIDKGFQSSDFKTDGWGGSYTYTDTLLRSTGSGGNIDKLFADSPSDLLANHVQGYVLDANKSVPGTVYKDSLVILLNHPNGTGSLTTESMHPTKDGYFSFSNIAIGNLTLTVIYTPKTDTMTVPITVYPSRDAKLSVIFPADLF
jgi:prepilin-type N-terminal cleavage/methylation domain-containing protein